METEQIEQIEQPEHIEPPEHTGNVKPTIIPDITRPNPAAEDQSGYIFIVATRDERQEITGRQAAVDAAKEITADDAQTATVEREDGRVKMQFRGGSLVDYVFETRKGRRA